MHVSFVVSFMPVVSFIGVTGVVSVVVLEGRVGVVVVVKLGEIRGEVWESGIMGDSVMM